MRRKIIYQALALALVLAAPVAQAELKYRIQDLGSLLGGDETLTPVALNNGGSAVGLSIFEGRGPTRLTGFQYDKGSLRALGPSGQWAEFYDPRAINDAGVSVGTYSNRPARTDIPVMFKDGKIIDLSPEPGVNRDGFAAAINKSGTVVGYVDRRAFIYDGTTSRYIPVGHPTQIVQAFDINDHGLVVGQAVIGNGFNFLWDGTNVTKLPSIGNLASFHPLDLNNVGAVLGMKYQDKPDGNSIFSAYIYADGHYQALAGAATGDVYFNASAMNDKGWVVGAQVGDPDNRFAVLWRDGQSFDLNTLVAGGAANAGWHLDGARDINERGQIIGSGIFNGVRRAFIATPVPEPESWALMLAGLGGLILKLRRRGEA